MKRITRAKRRVILLASAILLAALIGGTIGVWMRPSIDEVTERKLKTSSRSQLQKLLNTLDKTNDSPDTLESGDLCYYAILQHAAGTRFELSLLFLDALEKRFPDSPFVQKAETLRPLIETARKKKESPDAAVAAQTRLAIEALPLAVDAQARLTFMALPLGVSTSSQISSRPWWRLLPAESIIMASPESEHVDWPVRYTGKIDQGSPWNPDRIMMGSDRTLFAVRGLGTSPFRTLTASPTIVLPIVREHLDDPRLTGTPLNTSRHGPYEPRPVWRVCYGILCEAAGFRFDEIEFPARNRPFDRRFELTLTPKVRTYIDRWFDECLEMDQKESILWHLRQVDLRSKAAYRHFLRLGKMGSSDDALKLLHERLDPNDAEAALILAQIAAELKDNSLATHVARHFVEGRSQEPELAIRFIVNHGTTDDKARVLKHLKALPTQSSFSEEMDVIRHLALYGDTSKVPYLFEWYRDGSLRNSQRYWEVVTLLAEQKRPEYNQIIIERCLKTLSELQPPPKTVELSEHRDAGTALLLWRIHGELAARQSFANARRVRLFGAFLDWPVIIGYGLATRTSTTITRRICDQAAQKLVELKLVSNGFDANAPDRDEQIEAIRKELRERYPATHEPTATEERSE